MFSGDCKTGQNTYLLPDAVTAAHLRLQEEKNPIQGRTGMDIEHRMGDQP